MRTSLASALLKSFKYLLDCDELSVFFSRRNAESKG